MPEVPVRVVEVVEESLLDRTYVLEVVDERARFDWIPGQHTSILDPAAVSPKARWYSISCATRGDRRFEITVRARSTEDIERFGFKAGQALVATSPVGTFTLAFEPGDELLLLAAGSGIAPFRAFVQHMRGADARPLVTLVHKDRAPSTLLFRAELGRYADEGWLRYEPRVTGADHGEPWAGETGRVTDADVARFIRDPARTTVYACGPEDFVAAALAAAEAAGVPAPRLRCEGWG